jgi:hypothetical protein
MYRLYHIVPLVTERDFFCPEGPVALHHQHPGNLHALDLPCRNSIENLFKLFKNAGFIYG